MKFSIIIIFVIFPYFTILAQQKSSYVAGSMGTSFSMQSSFDDNKEKKDKVYYNNDWSNGNLVTKDNALLTNLSFRYDVKNDRFEMRSFLDPKIVNKITLNGKFFTYSEFIESGYKRAGYFELLNEGDVMLLIRRKINITPGKEGAYAYDSRQDVVKILFVKVGNKPAVEFDKKTDDILNYIPENKNKVEEYISSRRLNLKKTKNIIKIVNYYNNIEI